MTTEQKRATHIVPTHTIGQHVLIWRTGRATRVPYQVCRHCTFVQYWGRVPT